VAFSGGDEAIRLEHLSFGYADQNGLALRDVSLRVGRGEMVVIMGATGAGKTTLAKCLNRIVPAFQPGTLCGEIALFGQALRDEGVAELAGIVGLVSQDFEAQLFATNVVQEIVFGMEQLGVAPDEMRLRLPRVLHAVGLQGFEGRDPTTLSGGEKQRLALAATLALQPSIMVFDEPTTDLDPLGKLEIFAVLAAMRRQGYTLVVIEHEIAAAEHADRLVIMSHGEIVADDLPQRVLARVDFLRQHGVRAPDLNQLATRLHLSPPPCSLDAAEAAVRRGLGVGRPVIKPEEPFDKHVLSNVEGLRVSGECPWESGRESAHAELVEAVGGVREPPGLHFPTPFLCVEDVTFFYEGGVRALDGVSLTIDAGEFLAIIGQNGSGKTTLAKHLNGLLSPSAGRVLLRGVDMRSLPINTVAADVGYVFQNPDHQIFAASVHEEVAFGPHNLSLPPPEVEDRVHAALVAVGLTGLEGEDPFLLGKGQRQRLAVASVLALRPRLLILDEPTTGLDYLEQRRMMDLFAQLHAQGIAIVMITHTPWVVAEYARRGVLMADGRVLLDAPLRTLLAQEGLLEQAHFCAPDITRLGCRFGFTPLSVDEFVEKIGTGG
jgi:energy-coupling factor transport system ATP-binding protein